MTFRDVFLPGGDESSHLHDGGDISGRLPYVRVVAGVNIPALASRVAAAEGDISTLKDHSHSIDFAHEASGTNIALSSTFQTAVDLAYSPPPDWSTYRIQGQVTISVAGVTSGDLIQLVPLVGAATGTQITDDAVSDYRALQSFIDLDGLAGSINLLARVRNTTAARGTVYTAVASLVAFRQT